jgi:hypothetical protein
MRITDDCAMATTRRADTFTADGKPSEDDPCENGPRLGDERTTLVEALRCQRLTLEIKCAGLDAGQMARRSVEPSTMSLLGIVRHLAEGEGGGRPFPVIAAYVSGPAVRAQPDDAAGCAGDPWHHNRTGNTAWMSPIAVRRPARRSMAT